jgi:TolB protein
VRVSLASAVLASGALAAAACAPANPSPTGPAGSAGSFRPLIPPPSAAPSESAPSPSSVAASITPGDPLAASGSIAVLAGDGRISIVDAARHSRLLARADGGSYAFPAWSPDGTKLAVIRWGQADASILVFEVGPDDGSDEPATIFRSSTARPFYLSWTPDGRRVSFLSDEAGGLSLRAAEADGSTLGETDLGPPIRSGSPLYYDWIAGDRMVAHVGVGSRAFLGEIGLDGEPVAPSVESPGEFRPAVVSPDRSSLGFVREGPGAASAVVVRARDGSVEHTMPVFGVAAVEFSPLDSTLASIGPSIPAEAGAQIPVGPLRVMDAPTGKFRTLLDGTVVGFWWSPDGRTIAALRVQPVGGPGPPGAPAASDTPSAAPDASPSAPPREVRLFFLDVTSGTIESQAAVDPGQLFVAQLLAYFDQYALSHRLWAPDSSSLLMPIVDADGATRVAVMFRDGRPPAFIDGAVAFWSP